MKLDINLPKFKAPEFKGFTNPLTNEGIRGLAIVLGVIVIISGVVYVANFGKRRGSTILPEKTLEEATITPQPTIPTEIPTITPLRQEEELPASPSPTRKVRKPTATPTPVVEEVTATPAPTI